MEEMGMEMEDFFTDRKKSREFLEHLVEMAAEEVDFHSSGSMLAMQVMPLPDKSLAITFSDNQNEGLQGVLESIKDIAGMLGDNPDLLPPELQEALQESMEAAEQMAEKTAQKPTENVTEKNKKTEKNKMICIFCFDNLDSISDYAGSFGEETGIKSSVYKTEEGYYLVMEKGKMSKKEFRSMCERAIEFGRYESQSLKRLSVLKEHHTCVIRKKALDVLFGLHKV